MFKLDEKLMADNRALISIQPDKAGIDRLVKNGTLNYVGDTNDVYLTIPRSLNYGEYNRIIQEESDGKIPYDLIFKGNLTIEKDLVVMGDQVTMNTSTVSIEDNIVEINRGETGAGITLGAAGIQINRGSYGTANMLYDETEHAFVFDANGTIRFWSYDNGNAKTLGSFDTQALTANQAIWGKTTLRIDGASTLNSTLAVTGATTLSNTLSVTGAATMSSSITATGAAWFKNTLRADLATTLNDTLTVAKATTLNDTLSVAKTLSVTLGSTLTGAVSMGSTLGVTGATTLSNTLGVTGATTLSSTLQVNGASTLNGAVAINNTLTVNTGYATVLKGTLNGQAAVDFDSTLNVDGAVTFGSTLGVTGATTLSSTLGVTKAATFSDTVSIAKKLTTTIDAQIGTTLTVGTNASVGGTLTVTGSSILNSTLSVSGAASLSNTLTVTGLATLNGGLVSNGAVTVNNNLTLVRTTTDGNLTVGGTATFNGTSTFNQPASFTSITTSGNAGIGGNLTVTGTTGLTGAVTTTGTLGVGTNLTVGGTLKVTGTSTLAALNATNGSFSGTLGVTGATTLAGLTAGATTLSSLTVTNAASVGTTLAVTGASTFKDTVNAWGAVDFDNTLNVDGATTLGSTLDVGGNLWAKAQLTIDGATNLKSTVTITGATQINNTLTATGEIESQTNFSLSSGNGKGIRFWDNDAYKIYMSAPNDVTFGGRLDTSSDYNMYFKMTSGTNRGFVFMNGTTPIAQIESTGDIRYIGDAYKRVGATWYKVLNEYMYGHNGGINADMVEGLHADTSYSGTTNQLAVYDASKRVYDSARLEGAVSATAATANTIAKRDASSNLAIGTVLSFTNAKVKDASGTIEFKNAADNAYVWGTMKSLTLNDGSSSIKIKPESGAVAFRNSADTGYADIIINNLTVKGTTTTVNSETVTIDDNIIVLNNNYTGSAPTENGGIEVQRGTLANASLIWDEAADVWKAGLVGSEQTIILANDVKLSKLDSSGQIAWGSVTGKPTSYPATMITEDSTHKFVTDTQVKSWTDTANGQAAGYLVSDQSSEQVVSGSEVRVQSTAGSQRFAMEYNEATNSLQIVYYTA